MAEKDTPARLRRAVKENNLFLVKRLVQRTDMRNVDPAPRRLTSLAWAALLGHEETFEFLLSSGHDDRELSRDSENNTIIMVLADASPPTTVYSSTETTLDFNSATLRMARLYYDRFQSMHKDILDWSNVQGRTALHMAAIKGNEELVRMFCDLNADVNLSDDLGNTPLHYASAWGHVSIVQLLIERGCNYLARNNQGFVASEYAYSYSTQEMQRTAEKQYEMTKKTRRAAISRPLESGSAPINIPSGLRDVPRMRSGSGTSRTTATSDSGEFDGHGQPSFTASSSPSQPSTGSGSFFYSPKSVSHVPPAGGTTTYSSSTVVGKSSAAASAMNPASALSPVANRMRERDADAIEKYMRRNHSGSSSTDNKSQVGSTFSALPVHDELPNMIDRSKGGVALTPRRLRPSVSAAQLRTTYDYPNTTRSEHRTRAGTNPSSIHPANTNSRPTPSPIPQLTRSSSTSHSVSNSVGSNIQINRTEGPESFHGPPSQYAVFPEPPLIQDENSTPTAGRRNAFHMLTKNSSAIDMSNHRRGISATAVRGP